MDIFSTHVLNRVVENLERPASFLLDTYFTEEQTEDSEEIHFDIDKSKPRITPFVSPLVAGKVVDEAGYQTKSFRPAYVKDKRRFVHNRPLKRAIGEKIGGQLSPQRRMEIAVNRTLKNQLENLSRREEVMASEALRLGRVTVSGEDYETQVVDFQRDPELTITLTGGAQWKRSDESNPGNVNVLDDIEDWAGLIQDKSGAAARHVIMDPKAWRIFKNSPQVQQELDIRRGTNTDISIDPIAFGQGKQKARSVGSIGDFNFYVYNDVYVDDNDQVQKLLPDYTVIMASRESLEGVRCYGLIQDEKAKYKAQRYFTKSWLEEDPPLRWMMLQSAPLIVPYRPNASLCATIKVV